MNRPFRSPEPCRREADVLARHAAGDATAVRDHLEECESCRLAVRVSTALGTLAAEGPGFPLPDPAQVLWRARVLERFAARDAAAERAAWPLTGAAMVAVVVVLLATVTGFIVTDGAAPGWAAPWVSLVTGGVDPATFEGVLQIALWGGVAILAAAVGWAARAVFQEG